MWKGEGREGKAEEEDVVVLVVASPSCLLVVVLLVMMNDCIFLLLPSWLLLRAFVSVVVLWIVNFWFRVHLHPYHLS